MKHVFILVFAIVGITAGIKAADEFIRSNTVIIGDGAASDKAIEFNEGSGASRPKILWDDSNSKLQFSNDGTTFKDIGSGGGAGGLNLLQDSNPDFESQTTSWTASGGTFTATSTAANVANGTYSASWDASGSAQTLESAAVAVVNRLEGGGCFAEIYYKYESGSAGDYVLKVHDSSDTDLIDAVDLAVTSGWARQYAAFTCPTDESINVRLEAGVADPGTIYVDDVHLGSSKIDFAANDQAEVVFSGYYDSAANCIWQRSTSSLGAFTDDTDCPGITTEKVSSKVSVTTTDNDQPDLVFSYLPEGTYQVEAVFTASFSGSTDSRNTYGINDGTDTLGQNLVRFESAGVHIPVATKATFVHTGGAKTFTLYAFPQSGRTAEIRLNATTEGGHLTWTVTRFPSNAVDAVNLETQGMAWSGYHDSTCEFKTTSASFTTLGSDSTCTFGEYLNKGFGTVSTFDDGGSGKYAGIKFTPKRTGIYNVCASVSANSEIASGYARFRFLQNETDEIGQLGISRQEAGGANMRQNVHGCALVNVTSASEQIIEIEGSSDGTNNAGIYGSSMNAIDWVIYPITQNFPQAVALTNIDPQNFTAAEATRLGHYVYAHGTTYNGGNAPTVTLSSGGGSLSSVNLSQFIPYQMYDGSWRMKFNLRVSVSNTARTTAFFAINGVTFSSALQAITGDGNTSSATVFAAEATASSNTVGVGHASASTTVYKLSGDVALESKPTWAY